MKKIFFCVTCLFFSILLHAQTETETTVKRKNIIKTNPVGFLVGGFMLAYERKLGSGPISLSVEIMHTDRFYFPGYELSKSIFKDFGLYISSRYYFSFKKNYLQGVYAGLIIGSAVFQSDAGVIQSYVDVLNKEYDEKRFVGSVAGYQRLYKKRFFIDVYGGYVYEAGMVLSSRILPSGKNAVEPQNGFVPIFGFYIGYYF